MASPELSPEDKDYLIRTVIGEAGNQPPIGQAAVAHVILNRLNAGNYGKNAKDVVLAPSQFEPWSTRGRELRGIPNTAPIYGDIGNIVDKVVAGEIPDPTGGATHFANVKTVQDRGNNKAMGWINGMKNVTRIGDHTFGNADAQPFDFNGIIDSYGAAPASKASGGFDVNSIIDSYAKPENEVTAGKPEAGKNIGAGSIPITPPEGYYNGRLNITIPKSPLQSVREATNPTTAIPAIASDVGSHIVDAAKQGYQTFKKGVEAPNWLPSFETKPSTVTSAPYGNVSPATALEMKDPGRVLGALGGLLGMGVSPLTGSLKSGQDQLEKLTGNKDFAEKAMMMVPTGPLGRAANEVRPTVKATRSIADIVPDHYLPEALAAHERNPKLSLVDISQTARNRADMIAHDALAPAAQNAVLDFVDKRKNELSGDLRQTLEVLGELPTPYDVVTKIQQRAKETGQKIINPIVEKSKPAEITAIVSDIDAELAKATKSGLPLTDYQRRLSDLRDELRGTRNDRDQMFSDVKGEQGLHNSQWKLRAEADNLTNSASGAERNLGGKLMPWRNRIVDAIDSANPGYKEGLSKFRTDKQVAESFDRGLNINKKPGATSESILEHSAEALRDWVKNKNTHPDEIATARLGAMSWMVQELEGMRAGKKLMDSPKDKVMQDKLEALFGKSTANEYIDLMRDTHRKAQSASEIGAKGSQTFARGREAEAAPVRLPGKGDATPGTLQALALGGAGMAAEAVPFLSGFHGWPTALGLTAAAGRAGYSGLRSGYEHLRYKSDLARRMAEAKALTIPLIEQPDLIGLMRARQQNLNGRRLQLPDIVGASPILQALPR